MNKNKAQRNYLTALMGIFSLLLSFFIVAYYQKLGYNKRLESEVKSRTERLRESNILLKKTNKELDQFNHILSHDLKEPIRSIVGFSQLASRLPAGSEDKIREYVEIVQNSGEQLNELVNDVRNYRTSVNMEASDIGKVNLQSVIKDISSKLSYTYPEKSISIETTELPVIQNSPDLMLLLIHQLLDNSVKFNDNEKVKIKVKYTEKRDKHILEISDNGIGIAEEYHRQIFTMFERLNNRKEFKGSGLGLSLSKRLAAKVKADVSLKSSRPGMGSVFQLETEKRVPQG